MPTKPLFDPEFIADEQYRALYAQVCKTASVDALKGEMDAMLWLLTDARPYFEFLDMDYKMIYKQVKTWYIDAVITGRQSVGKTFIEDVLGVKYNTGVIAMWRRKWVKPLTELVKIEIDRLEKELC